MNSHFQSARAAAQQCTNATTPIQSQSNQEEATVASDPVRRNGDWTGVQHLQIEVSMNQDDGLSNDKDKEII